MPMGWNDDRSRLEDDIRQLRALMETQPGLAADMRVTGLAALVQAQSSLLAADALKSAMATAEGDVAGPLALAMRIFAEKAELLSYALRRLPDY